MPLESPSTPKKLIIPVSDKPFHFGYSMPAEWEPHESTWLAWPYEETSWPGRRLAKVQDIYRQMIEALLPYEKVHLLVPDKKTQEKVTRSFKNSGIAVKNLIFHPQAYADIWIRDYGPSFIKNAKGEKALCKWIFNAWGSKYPDLAGDTKIFEEGQALTPHRQFTADIVMEGGSIEVNGAGTCLTTEQCLLHKNRNPHLSRAQIEDYLRDYLGVTRIIWLAGGIEGDDTDGHIDDVTRFVSKDTVISVLEKNPDDKNYEVLRKNWERLKTSQSESGKPWNLVEFPMPKKVVDGGTVLPASYANFYIANGSVLLPVYGDKSGDDRAKKISKELFPAREIIAIPCNALVHGLGAIHCVTQQEPV